MNREKASKLMHKNYYLVNEKSGEKITVYPPMIPGINAQKNDKKKNDAGEWIRRFDIIDANGIKQFDGQAHIVLTHLPKMAPTVVINGEKWTIRAITKEPASTKKLTAPVAIKKDEEAATIAAAPVVKAKPMLERAKEDIMRKHAKVENHAALGKMLAK